MANVEFSTATPWGPLVVIITRTSIEVSNQPVPTLGATTYRDVMKNRLNLFPKNQLAYEWTARRKGRFSPRAPHCLEDEDHVPIMVHEHEQIDFRYNGPGGDRVMVHLDRDFWVTGNGPDYATDHSAEMFMEHLLVTVQGPVSGLGPADQRFYKTRATIMNSGGLIYVDPDAICDR